MSNLRSLTNVVEPSFQDQSSITIKKDSEILYRHDETSDKMSYTILNKNPSGSQLENDSVDNTVIVGTSILDLSKLCMMKFSLMLFIKNLKIIII